MRYVVFGENCHCGGCVYVGCGAFEKLSPVGRPDQRNTLDYVTSHCDSLSNRPSDDSRVNRLFDGDVLVHFADPLVHRFDGRHAASRGEFLRCTRGLGLSRGGCKWPGRLRNGSIQITCAPSTRS